MVDTRAFTIQFFHNCEVKFYLVFTVKKNMTFIFFPLAFSAGLSIVKILTYKMI